MAHKKKNAADKALPAVASATTAILFDAENVALTAAAATTTMPTPANDNATARKPMPANDKAKAAKPAPAEVDAVKPTSTDPPIPPSCIRSSSHHWSKVS